MIKLVHQSVWLTASASEAPDARPAEPRVLSLKLHGQLRRIMSTKCLGATVRSERERPICFLPTGGRLNSMGPAAPAGPFFRQRARATADHSGARRLRLR